MPTMSEVDLAIAAIVCGMMFFALAVLIGQGIVRALALSRDLPPGPRFEPPPPPLRHPHDPGSATGIAMAQHRRQAIGDEARQAAFASALCQELEQMAIAAGPTAAAMLSGIQTATVTAMASAKDAERDMGLADAADAESRVHLSHQAAAAALARCRSLCATLPVQGSRMRRLLRVVTVILLLWLVAILCLGALRGWR